jgi:hypothetical protein
MGLSGLFLSHYVFAAHDDTFCARFCLNGNQYGPAFGSKALASGPLMMFVGFSGVGSEVGVISSTVPAALRAACVGCQASNGWQCVRCSYNNKPLTPACLMCQAAQGASRPCSVCGADGGFRGPT